MLQPVVLTVCLSEGEAHAIVDALAGEGIRAWSMGGTPIEGPVSVKVMVLRADEEFARATLEVVKAEAGAIDWDEVDVGANAAEAHEPRDRARSSRLSLTGLGVIGAGTGLIVARDVVLASMPQPVRSLPGGVLVVAGVVWCVRHSRRAR